MVPVVEDFLMNELAETDVTFPIVKSHEVDEFPNVPCSPIGGYRIQTF